MVETLVEWDKEFFLYLNQLGTPPWDSFWLFMTDKWSSIPLYAILLLLCFKFLGWKKTGLVLVFVALLITTTDQLANFFKYGVQRLRPCHDTDLVSVMRLVKRSCGGKFGYFSAHAGSSMAVASFFSILLGKHLKWLPGVLVIWALILGYSRIYIGVHFPLDVLTGICIGLLFGWVYAKLYIFAQQKIRV